MASYIKPSVRVYQELGVTATATTPDLNACIVGPNKKFLDYSIAEDKTASFVGTYDNTLEQVVAYPGRGAGEVVDQDTVALYFDDVEAELYQAADGTTDSLEPNVLRSGTAGFYFKDFTNPKGVSFVKSSLLHNRGVLADDTVLISDGVTSHSARVISFESDITDPVFGSFSADSKNHQSVNFVGVLTEPVVAITAGTGTAELGVRGFYEHEDEDTIYTITCTTGGALGVAEFTVADSGTDITGTVALVTQAGVNSYALGSRGLTLYLDDTAGTFDNVGPDTFTVTCTAPVVQDGYVKVAGSYTSNEDLLYTVTVVDKGVSGVARVRVTTPNSVDDSGPHTVKDGVPFEIGSRGAQVVFTFPSDGLLVPGDAWQVQARGDGLGPVTVLNDVGGEADTFVLGGQFSGTEDVRLEVTTTTGGAFGTAVFDWEMFVESTAATRRASVASGTITTLGTDDENTVYVLSAGITITLTPDGGTFTVLHSDQARLYARGVEQATTLVVHDQDADTPSLVTLSAVPSESNFGVGVVTENVGPGTGTYSVGGLYRSNEDTTYSIVENVAGALGTAILDVTDTGTDVATQTIQTQAGVTRYFIGTRGLILTVSSDFVSGGFDVDVATTTTAVPSATVTQGYTYSNKLQYEITCTTGGALGTAAFSVTSTNNLDDDTFTTSVGTFEYAIGSRGVKVTFALGDAAGFTAGQKWTIDTAVDSTYTRTVDDTYTVEVTKSGDFGVAQVKVTSTGGDSAGPYVLQEDPAASLAGWSVPVKLGAGTPLVRLVDSARSTVSPDLAATFVEGDKWTISITAEVVGGLNGLKLSKAIPSTLLDSASLNYTIYMRLDDVLVPEDAPLGGTNYLTDATTVTVDSAITVQSPDVYDLVGGQPVAVDMAVKTGAKMHLTYVALDTSGTATLDSITDIDEIEGKLGRIDPRNPLAYGVFKARQNAVGKIYFLRVSSDDSVGFQEALDLLEQTDQVYALCPLTKDTGILGAFKQHVELLSSPEKNLWRIVFLNQDLVTQEDVIVQRTNALGDLVDYVATITDDPNSADLNPPIFTRVIDTEATFILDGVTPGDILLTDYVTDPETGDLVATSSYEVDSITSDEELILKTGPNTPVALAQKYQIVRPLSKDEQASNHAGIATSYGSRRVYLVWPDFVEADGESVDGFFACAALCGMVAGFPPHQGFTNISLAGFEGASRSFEYFTSDQLDTMAGGGVYILTQDALDAQVFTRHQVSTDNTSVETRELSITKTLDYLSVVFRDTLKPFIGKWNIVRDTLRVMETALLGAIEFQRGQTLPRIGAPLINATINFLRQNDLLKDHVDVDIDLELPFPLNVINLTLRI